MTDELTNDISLKANAAHGCACHQRRLDLLEVDCILIFLDYFDYSNQVIDLIRFMEYMRLLKIKSFSAVRRNLLQTKRGSKG